jgi:hypothetical protein
MAPERFPACSGESSRTAAPAGITRASNFWSRQTPVETSLAVQPWLKV